MEVFDNRYYKYNKLFLRSIGCWVYDTGLQKHFFQASALFSLMASLIPQILFIYFNRSDVDTILSCGPAVLVIATATLQFIIYHLSKKKLREMLEIVKNDWDVRKERLELEILKKYGESARFYSWLFLGNVGTATVIVIIMSMTNPVLDWLIPQNETRSRQGVFDAALPFDQTEYFYWILLYGTFTALYNLSIVCSCESFLSAMTLHACGLFSILSFKLKIITEKLDNGKVNMYPQVRDAICKEVNYLIEDHTHALNFASSLNSMYSPFLFITVGVNVIVISFSGLGMLTTLDEPDTFIKYMAYTIGVFIHFYCVALPAQKLLDHSGDIARSAYDICWYNIPMKSRKLMLLLVQRSQKPCRLTVGKFYSMDMETFSAGNLLVFSFFSIPRFWVNVRQWCQRKTCRAGNDAQISRK